MTTDSALSPILSALSEIWQRATGRSEPPTDAAVLVMLAVSIALVAWRPSWRIVRHAVTLVHEGGHAVVATLAGRRLSGVRLHSDSSGLTITRGRPDGAGMVATSLAGYLAPAALGLGAAVLIRSGYPVAVLWLLMVALVLLAVRIRNWFGAWVVLVTGVVLAVVGVALPVEAQTWAAAILAIVLLVSAPRGVVDLQRARRSQRRAARGRAAPQSDADTLAALTRVPAVLWVALFFVLTVGAALAGLGALLVPTAP